jgi:murein DD-endopeptidase MepM/ murein hydrolase activator NlpD
VLDYRDATWSTFDIGPMLDQFVQLGKQYPSFDTPPPPIPPPPDGKPKIVRPVNRIISQMWGDNPQHYIPWGSPYHNGTDYARPLGTPVLAMADGVVAWVDTDGPGYGRYIRIWHPILNLHTFYAHLDEQLVAVGNRVLAGRQIGTVGNTGNSTGPHLHFEIRLGDGDQAYEMSPYADMQRGRINPETFFAVHERLTT